MGNSKGNDLVVYCMVGIPMAIAATRNQAQKSTLISADAYNPRDLQKSYQTHFY